MKPLLTPKLDFVFKLLFAFEWLYFLNYAHEEDETMRTQYTNPMIHKAFEVLETLSADELTRQRAEMREKALKNEVSMLEAARNEGLQQGLQQGQIHQLRESMIEILRVRFDRVPDALIQQLTPIDDLTVLSTLLKYAATVESVEEFAALPDLQTEKR